MWLYFNDSIELELMFTVISFVNIYICNVGSLKVENTRKAQTQARVVW